MPRTRTITVPVDVPSEIEEAAARKAILNDDPDQFEEYLLDYIRFDYEWDLENDPP